jgi:photosystem II stability/assembly factor-like uncharacterized protein
MRKTILSILIVICCFTLNAQWTAIPSGTTNDLYSVHFTSRDTGYAVGKMSILRTVNGGSSWVSLPSGNDKYLLSVYFTDANTAYSVGYRLYAANYGYPNIFRTKDKCLTWDSLPIPGGTTKLFYSVYFTSIDTGYVAGSNGVIMKTTNKGLFWTILTTPPINANTLNSIYFTNSKTGYAVGWMNMTGLGGTILKTSNAGMSWDTLSIGTQNGLLSIYFTSKDTGYAVGIGGTIIKTVNGGASWSRLSSGTNSWLYSVYFTDANTGYVVGCEGTILKTVNAGSSWAKILSNTDVCLVSTHFRGKDTCFVVGSNGAILKTTNGGCGELTKSITSANITCNGDNNGIIKITPNGGTSPYQYSKDNGVTYQTTNIFNNLIVGNYNIVIKDANKCVSNSQVVSISQPPIVSFSTTQSDVTCNGGNNGIITITPNGGTSPYQYSKDNGVTYQTTNVFKNLITSNYIITIKDANTCVSNSQIVSISQPPVISYSTTQSDVTCTGCNNGSITITANGGKPFYQYSNNNGSTYQVSNVFTDLAVGNYTIVIKDSNSCISNSGVIGISQSTAIYSVISNQYCLIYPNPSSGIVYLGLEHLQISEIKVLDYLGKEVYYSKTKVSQIDLKSITKGTYFLIIITNEGIINKKLIFQ